MRSIYAQHILQRILDHWGVGKIENSEYFTNVGAQIWRHYIETNQGSFELYSYPSSEKEYAEEKLTKYFEKQFGDILPTLRKKEIVHSFDRYHVVVQLQRKHGISLKQASRDLKLLPGLQVDAVYRVYGSIIQLELSSPSLDKKHILFSYGSWSIQDYEKGRANVVAGSKMHSYDQLDTAIDRLQTNAPTIEKYILHNGWFELYLSNKMSIHFGRSDLFPAVQINFSSRKNSLLVFHEQELYYVRDLRDESRGKL